MPDAMPWLATAIVAVIGALFGGGGVAAIMSARTEGRVAAAQSTSDIQDHLTQLVTNLTSQLGEALERLNEAQQLIDELRSTVAGQSADIARLRQQVAELTEEVRLYEQGVKRPKGEV